MYRVAHGSAPTAVARGESRGSCPAPESPPRFREAPHRLHLPSLYRGSSHASESASRTSERTTYSQLALLREENHPRARSTAPAGAAESTPKESPRAQGSAAHHHKQRPLARKSPCSRGSARRDTLEAAQRQPLWFAAQPPCVRVPASAVPLPHAVVSAPQLLYRSQSPRGRMAVTDAAGQPPASKRARGQPC